MQMDRRYRREWPCCNGPGGTVGGELPGRHGGVASVVQKQFAALGSICVKLNVGEGCQRAPAPGAGATSTSAGCRKCFWLQNKGHLRCWYIFGKKRGAGAFLIGAGPVKLCCARQWVLLSARRWVPPSGHRSAQQWVRL